MAAPVIAGLMHGGSLADPVVYLGVAVTVLLASLVASWIPARRASNVDPNIALRA
jgi:ABC-type lipoprotein release transport system permease subunit